MPVARDNRVNGLWLKALVKDMSEHTFLHMRHRYGRSPECVRMCVVTEEDWEKRRSHTRHRKGFSPECVRMCAVRLAA